MDEFKQGHLQLLVATTVIEVGVDVPNASLMIIENPERLGLAQLHQLRGRVGRGSAASHCVLLYHAPLSQLGRERLAIMRETTDGFIIAEKDLELRTGRNAWHPPDRSAAVQGGRSDARCRSAACRSRRRTSSFGTLATTCGSITGTLVASRPAIRSSVNLITGQLPPRTFAQVPAGYTPRQMRQRRIPI